MHQNMRMVIPPLNEDFTDLSQSLPGSVCSVLFSTPDIFLFSTQPLVTNQPFVYFSNCFTFIFKQILSNSNSH